MTEIWGNKWASQYGVIANYDGEWAEMLLSLSMQEIATGLEAEKQSEDKWPSPVPVFRKNAEGGGVDFYKTFNMCVYWSNADELQRRGLVQTREGLFIMRLIGSELRNKANSEAEKLVKFAIKEMKSHLEAGGGLPEFPKAEIDFVPLPKIGVSFAEVMKQAGVV